MDEDCNGAVDDGAIDAPTWFADVDSDGFGGDQAQTRCEPPGGHSWILLTGDCDDLAFGVNPNAEEVCNRVDDDCDGVVDEGC